MITIEKSRQFIAENEAFFIMPLLNQRRVVQFYTELGKLDALRDYSTKLTALLYAKREKLSDLSYMPVIYPWRDGNFEPAIKHEEIRQFLQDNKDHPALVLWREQAFKRTIKDSKDHFFALLTKLNTNIKYLGENVAAGNNNYIVAADAATILTRRLNALGDDFFSKPFSKAGAETFRDGCQQAIESAEQEFKHHRGFWHKNVAPIVKQIIGLIACLFTAPLLLSANYRKTIRDTFFSIPTTNSSKELKTFKDGFFGNKDDFFGTDEEDSSPAPPSP